MSSLALDHRWRWSTTGEAVNTLRGPATKLFSCSGDDQTGGYDEISADYRSAAAIAPRSAVHTPTRTKSTACCWSTERETGMAKKIALKIEEMTAATLRLSARFKPPGTRRPIGGSAKDDFACDGDTSVSVIWQPKAPYL